MPEYTLIGSDSYPVLEVRLPPGERFVSDAGAMAWMETGVRCRTAMRGGLFSSLSRKFLGGESLFQNTYEGTPQGGLVALAPGSPGTIVRHELAAGEDLLLEKGAYLGSTEGVKLESKWQGLKGLFNEGLFILRAVGPGTMFFHGYGDVRVVELDGGRYVVDNGYAVAWDSTLTYRITRARKIRSFLFSDQLLLRFEGRGRVWVQSRSPQALASFVHPYRPVKRSD